MSERLKRILVICAFVGVTLGFAYAIYYLFFRPTGPAVVPGAKPPGVTGQLPGAGQAVPSPTGVPGAVPPGGLPSAVPVPTLPGFQTITEVKTRVLTDIPANNISLSPTGQGIRFYDPSTGKFYRILDDGTQVELSDQTFFNVDTVTWGNDSNKAILTFPDGSKIVYDFDTKKQVTLPQHWEDFNFSPSDDHLVAKSIGNNETNRFLIVAKSDGTDARTIEDLGTNADQVHVSWSPTSQIIAYSFTGDPIGQDRQNVVMLGQNHENFKYLVTEGRGFLPNWSPSGHTLLYSVYNSGDGYRPTLWVSTVQGDEMNANRRNLSLNTWADKCTWLSETKLACAVPTSIEEGAALQREITTDVPDFIYTIDLETAAVVNHGQPDGSPSIHQILPTPDKTGIYYNDNASGKLVKFTL